MADITHKHMKPMLLMTRDIHLPGSLRPDHKPSEVLVSMLNLQPDVLTPPRKDVLPVTPWLAPIIWDRTFNTDILNEQFQLQNITIGLTVFVLFLKTAEKYFMVGHRVNYYIFTDWPDYFPRIPLQKGRQIVILKVQSCDYWQEISMHCMEVIRNFTEQRFHEEVNYLVCANVDMKFSDHVGMEILSSLFGTLHSYFYELSRENFPHECRPQPPEQIPALYHKPTKILSPEYMWAEQKSKGIWDEQKPGLPYNIKRIRFKTVN
ncbi:hypothetical protein FD755_006117 [Muntiacus reevesi]|uniref:Uncharacterized protein n=1 Tax=Muntiacus reevesi TaxID=9886 RepID=A0A5J5MVA8_MUNRE|nr:hypothetical protein FD755_006117 [Muntiacus reevesi]